MFFYTVRCQFAGNAQSADHWLAWLRDIHIDEVISCGALGGDVVQMDNEITTFEIRYRFNSRESFQEYEKNHAPRLRQEGLELFPLDQGLSYERTSGELLFSIPAADASGTTD